MCCYEANYNDDAFNQILNHKNENFIKRLKIKITYYIAVTLIVEYFLRKFIHISYIYKNTFAIWKKSTDGDTAKAY